MAGCVGINERRELKRIGRIAAAGWPGATRRGLQAADKMSGWPGPERACGLDRRTESPKHALVGDSGAADGNANRRKKELGLGEDLRDGERKKEKKKKVWQNTKNQATGGGGGKEGQP
jgi:hypothetical protein